MHYSSAISTAHPFGFLAGSDLNCNFFSLSSSSSPPPAHTDETDMSSSDLFATSSKPVVKCKSVPLDLSYTIWKDSIFIENQQHFIQNEEQICRRNFTLVDIYDHCNLRMLHAIAIVETSKRSHNWSWKSKNCFLDFQTWVIFQQLGKLMLIKINTKQFLGHFPPHRMSWQLGEGEGGECVCTLPSLFLRKKKTLPANTVLFQQH